MSAVGDADCGMTLIESLVVLAILGLVSSLSVIQIDHALRLYSLREAVSAVAADMKMAKSRSIKSGQSITFSFNDDGSTYGWGSGSVRYLPAGVHLSSAQSGPIYFYPDGSSSGGTVIVVNGGGSRSIAVNATTGATTETPS
jgi:general secretion pathway protein H